MIVRVFQSLAQLDCNLCDFAPLESPTLTQFILEAVPFDQFHGIEQRACLLAITKETHNIRMPEFLERLDLGLESNAKSLVNRQSRGEDFDCGRFAGFGIDG